MSLFGFLGSGNMAGALIDGMIRAGESPASITCLGGTGASASLLATRTGITHARDTDQLCAGADVIVVAFKPKHLASLLPSIAEATRGKLVLSILAGKTLATLKSVFPNARAIVRVMPNTPGRIGAGISAWCSDAKLGEGDARRVAQLLGALGSYHEVPESLMDAVTAVGGSGPGFVFEFTAALREAAVAAGFSNELADVFARSVVNGSGRLLEGGADPEALRNQVTSPGGTTAAGLAVFDRAGFRAIVRDAVLAATKRGGELARDT